MKLRDRIRLNLDGRTAAIVAICLAIAIGIAIAGQLGAFK